MSDNMNDFFVFFEPGIPVPSKNIRAFKKNNICPDGWIRMTESEYASLLESSDVVNWLTWSEIRTQRSALLASSDWRILPDSPLSPEKIQEWKTYRQALRDITQAPSPDLVAWPTPPTA